MTQRGSTASSMSFAPNARLDQSLEEAFPSVDPGLIPYGSRVLVQARSPKAKTKGGIILTAETQATIQWNTQVGKVIAVGPAAFKNRDTLQLWPEGEWCKPGEFVRVGKYGGDRFEVPLQDGSVAIFTIFDDLQIIGKITCDPLQVIAFV